MEWPGGCNAPDLKGQSFWGFPLLCQFDPKLLSGLTKVVVPALSPFGLGVNAEVHSREMVLDHPTPDTGRQQIHWASPFKRHRRPRKPIHSGGRPSEDIGRPGQQAGKGPDPVAAQA